MPSAMDDPGVETAPAQAVETGRNAGLDDAIAASFRHRGSRRTARCQLQIHHIGTNEKHPGMRHSEGHR